MGVPVCLSCVTQAVFGKEGSRSVPIGGGGGGEGGERNKIER